MRLPSFSMVFCAVVQATGCFFDTQTFVSTSLQSIFDQVSTIFIVTTLAELFNVPAF